MTHPPAAAAAAPPPQSPWSFERWWPLAAALVALAPDPRAALPGLTYYFRDFTVTFYPLRLFAARELAAGRWPAWNPFVNEGTFALPVLYPPDLLHVVWSGPAVVSWLLTMHLPLAALAAYALARDLGVGRGGAFLAGAVFGLGGLTLSSLNLYVFLQALALAPLVALALRRAALRGGRWVAAAAAMVGLSVLTLALEFAVQGIALGLVLAWADRPGRGALLRLAAALVLGLGVAAVPVATIGAILPETVRGTGFDRSVALGNEVHPAALLQLVLPRVFGDPASPAEAWWGGRFSSKGFPYFLTVYVGMVPMALAAVGMPGLVGRRRLALLVPAALALWYALGAPAGLATAVAAVPGMSWFRFPSKALLFPFMTLALVAGMGLERVAAGRGWRAMGACALGASAVGGVVWAAAAPVSAWVVGQGGATVPLAMVTRVIARDGLHLALSGALAAAAAFVAFRRPAWSGRGAVVVGAIAVVDLIAAARGINPQAPTAFFQPLPEIASLRLDALDGGRVFSYGLDASPAFRRFLHGSGAPGRGLWSFFVSRQMLAPYANIIDRVELAEGKDLTSFIPHPPSIGQSDLEPAAVASLLPKLRHAGVTRVVSLDPLAHPDLALLRQVPAGPPGLQLFFYALSGSAPRLRLTCADAAPCGAGRIRPVHAVPGDTIADVEAEADARLVVREAYARGWVAAVDGELREVQRAEGQYMAVAVPAGAHRVSLKYHPPGLRAGAVVMAAALVAIAAIGVAPWRTFRRW